VLRIIISSKIFERIESILVLKKVKLFKIVVLKLVITECQITQKKKKLNLGNTKANIFKRMALKLVIT